MLSTSLTYFYRLIFSLFLANYSRKQKKELSLLRRLRFCNRWYRYHSILNSSKPQLSHNHFSQLAILKLLQQPPLRPFSLSLFESKETSPQLKLKVLPPLSVVSSQTLMIGKHHLRWVKLSHLDLRLRATKRTGTQSPEDFQILSPRRTLFQLLSKPQLSLRPLLP